MNRNEEPTMEDYESEDRRQESQGRSDFDEWTEWCEAQDAANNAPYWPTPEEMGRCYSGAHDTDAGCCCDPYYCDESIPFTLTLSPEQQIANVQAVLFRFCKRLQYWGLTMSEARRIKGRADTHRLGRRRFRANMVRISDCWAAVAALDHWRSLKQKHAAGTLLPVAVDEDYPF
jgi:hypothetical protein